MPIKHRFYDDVYAEVDYISEGNILSLSIHKLTSKGEISYTNALHTVIDHDTNKYLLDIAMDVDENGYKGSKLL